MKWKMYDVYIYPVVADHYAVKAQSEEHARKLAQKLWNNYHFGIPKIAAVVPRSSAQLVCMCGFKTTNHLILEGHMQTCLTIHPELRYENKNPDSDPIA